MLLGAELNKSRVIHVRGKQVPDFDGNGIPSLDGLRGDNDRATVRPIRSPRIPA
jgi:hypothetical protein